MSPNPEVPSLPTKSPTSTARPQPDWASIPTGPVTPGHPDQLATPPAYIVKSSGPPSSGYTLPPTPLPPSSPEALPPLTPQEQETVDTLTAHHDKVMRYLAENGIPFDPESELIGEMLINLPFFERLERERARTGPDF